MTAIATTDSAPAFRACVPETGAARFRGNDRAYWRLMLRGAVLLMLTLGLYRFWLATDMRRFLWSNSELAGEPLEYTGTALELLLGFLIAIALLAPAYGVLLFAALSQGVLGGLAGLLGFGLGAVLGPYAVFRARRYRLTRTVYRGVRFHQTGSAWRYALCALLWWTLAALTLGLAYPWTVTSLERFKMRNTFYGELPGRFEGSALWLFARGVPMWVLVGGPLLASLVITVRIVDWSALADALEQDPDFVGYLEGTGIDKATGLIMAALGWTACAASILYPTFQALVLRWWTSGLRFGALVIFSHLRVGQVYGIYFRFLLFAALFAVAAGVGGFLGLTAMGVVLVRDASLTREALATGLLLVGYVIMALGFSTIYQVTVKLPVWRLTVESLAVSGLPVLEGVKAAGRPSSALGEGLADALNVGGI